MPDAAVSAQPVTPLAQMREDFAVHGCGSREEFDAIVKAAEVVFEQRAAASKAARAPAAPPTPDAKPKSTSRGKRPVRAEKRAKARH